MSSELENRQRLTGLIYELNHFTVEQIAKEYRQASTDENLALGGLQSIRGYLKDLAQLGALRQENGVYSVSGYGENKY
jgi:hypothetical protein